MHYKYKQYQNNCVAIEDGIVGIEGVGGWVEDEVRDDNGCMVIGSDSETNVVVW